MNIPVDVARQYLMNYLEMLRVFTQTNDPNGRCNILVHATQYLNHPVLGPHVKGDEITLNISDSATRDYMATPEGISFRARFGGKETHVDVAYETILAVVTPLGAVAFGATCVLAQEIQAPDSTFNLLVQDLRIPLVVNSGEAPVDTKPKRPSLSVVK